MIAQYVPHTSFCPHSNPKRLCNDLQMLQIVHRKKGRAMLIARKSEEQNMKLVTPGRGFRGARTIKAHTYNRTHIDTTVPLNNNDPSQQTQLQQTHKQTSQHIKRNKTIIETSPESNSYYSKANPSKQISNVNRVKTQTYLIDQGHYGDDNQELFAINSAERQDTDTRTQKIDLQKRQKAGNCAGMAIQSTEKSKYKPYQPFYRPPPLSPVAPGKHFTRPNLMFNLSLYRTKVQKSERGRLKTEHIPSDRTKTEYNFSNYLDSATKCYSSSFTVVPELHARNITHSRTSSLH